MSPPKIYLICVARLTPEQQVSVDTTIKADQKAFFKETGTLPEKHIMPGTRVSADAIMSPMASE